MARNQPQQGLHQAALASAVGTDQGGVGLGAQRKADVVDSDLAAAPHAQVADFENRFTHHHRLEAQGQRTTFALVCEL